MFLMMPFPSNLTKPRPTHLGRLDAAVAVLVKRLERGKAQLGVCSAEKHHQDEGENERKGPHLSFGYSYWPFCLQEIMTGQSTRVCKDILKNVAVTYLKLCDCVAQLSKNGSKLRSHEAK